MNDEEAIQESMQRMMQDSPRTTRQADAFCRIRNLLGMEKADEQEVIMKVDQLKALEDDIRRETEG